MRCIVLRTTGYRFHYNFGKTGSILALFFLCFTILYIEKGEIILKKLSLVFAGLLITFFVSWGIKVKMPVNRPDNTETASTVKWYETKYTAPVADVEWILDPEIPDNYVPVAGEDEVYMVLDDSGNITGYRQRTQQEDGSWLWADVKNPNASYESVDGLKQVYKVTDKKGNISYEQYVRNEDGSYAYVPVNKKGIPLDDGSDASTIDNNHYVHASGNVYGLYNDNGVLIEEVGFYLIVSEERKLLITPSKRMLSSLCRWLHAGTIEPEINPFAYCYLVTSLHKASPFSIIVRTEDADSRCYKGMGYGRSLKHCFQKPGFYPLLVCYK